MTLMMLVLCTVLALLILRLLSCLGWYLAPTVLHLTLALPDINLALYTVYKEEPNTIDANVTVRQEHAS